MRGRFAYDNNGDGEKDILARGIRARPWPDIDFKIDSKIICVKNSRRGLRCDARDDRPRFVATAAHLDGGRDG